MGVSLYEISWEDTNTLRMRFSETLDAKSVPYSDAFEIYGNFVSILGSHIEGSSLYLTLESDYAAELRASYSNRVMVNYDPQYSSSVLKTAAGKSVGYFDAVKTVSQQVVASDIFLTRSLMSGSAAALSSVLSEACWRNLDISGLSGRGSLTLSLDYGTFSSATAAAVVSADGKSVTISGTQSAIQAALKKVSLNATSDLTARLAGQSLLLGTVTAVLSGGGTQSSAQMHLFAEDRTSSLFALSGTQYGYVNSLSGLSASSFRNLSYTSAAVIDAEKSPARISDDYLCWAGSASNMLTWAGYADNIGAYGTQAEDAVFQKYWSNFSDEGSLSSYGLSWYTSGLYDVPYGWAEPSAGGGYTGSTPATFMAHDYLTGDTGDLVDDLAGTLFAGGTVGLGIYMLSGDSVYGGHAITCWGLSFDATLSPDNHDWLTGFYITDSDDNKNTTSPGDTMRYTRLSWDDYYQAYRMVDYSGGSYYWNGVYSALNPEDSLSEVLMVSGTCAVRTAATVISSGEFLAGATFVAGETLSVRSGGRMVSATLKAGAAETVAGSDTKAVIYGQQTVTSGGSALNARVQNGGVQAVSGSAHGTEVASGGRLEVRSGGYASAANVLAGGSLSIAGGGRAVSARIVSGAQAEVSGSAQSLSVAGQLTVKSGGTAGKASVQSGGRLTVKSGGSVEKASVLSGGVLNVEKGGRTVSAVLKNGAVQNVSGSAQSTSVQSGGRLNVLSGGTVSAASILSGGRLTVNSGGSAVSSTVQSGATLALAAKATAQKVTVSGGTLSAAGGAILNSVVLRGGAKFNFVSGVTFRGTSTFTGSVITGGSAAKRVALTAGAAITAGSKTNMSKLHLNIAGAGLSFTGAANTLGSVALNAKSTVNYNISAVSAKGNTLMLRLGSRNSQKTGRYQVTVAKRQTLGQYELSYNMVQNKNTAYTLKQGSVTLGTVRLNGSSLTKNGMIYTLRSAGSQINLDVALKAGTIRRGTAKNETLSGTQHSDIFYGGRGNDVIKGTNGRDVAVYDGTAWGRDVIAATGGTMTILFKDLKAANVTSKLSGSTMVLTRKGVSGQSITIQGWNSATHNIVYGGTMSSMNRYLAAARPATALTNAARNEVWKKAGLVKV